MSDSRIILGIDPGLANVGWGVVKDSAPSLELVAHGCIRTTRERAHAERLLAIYRGLREAIEEFRPSVMAVEEVFQGRNPRSALLSGEGRGACLLAWALSGLRVVEYPATVVKVALTGNGRAAKVQVQAMVTRLLGLCSPPTPQDASDALAVAITFLQRGPSMRRASTGGHRD